MTLRTRRCGGRHPRADVLRQADVVSLHVPLAQPELLTRADGPMKLDAMLNTARGGVVDEVVLAAALKAGGWAARALDVRAEPLAAGSPPAAPNLCSRRTSRA
jgi:phosphoglycerate dehydrogenase-like enzyme